MKLIPHLTAVALALAASGCTRIGFTLANMPGYFTTTEVTRDVPFGSAARQKLDIYSPAEHSDTPRDVVVFFYGGRWETGTRQDYRFVGEAFAKRGFITIIPDYAKYPDVKFPVFVEDGAKALAWVFDNASKLGGNPARIHVAGHSAGAHIGALLSVDPHYLQALGKDRAAVIHDFTGLAGPYSFVPDAPDLIDMFGPPANYPLMQATTFVDGTQPPMLLLWGADDTDVKRSNLDKMIGAIHAKGGCLTTKIYPKTTHVGIAAGLTWMNPDHISVLQDMSAYFNAHPLPGKCPTLDEPQG
jgi:acetyl esterase/lipase